MRLGKSISPRGLKSMAGGFFEGTPSTSQQSSQPGWASFPEVTQRASDIATGKNQDYAATLANAISGGRESLDLARDLAFGGAGKAQYSQAASRWRNEFMPGLTARGLATSGPGIDIEAQKLQEMAIDQQAKGVQLLQDASKGLALLESLPEEMRAKIMAMIFGAAGSSQGTSTGATPSLWSELTTGIGQLGQGAQGVAAMAKI